MRLLLDTHALFWWLYGPQRLPETVLAAISDPQAAVFVSAVSAYEMAYKHGLGKWPEVGPLVNAFGAVLAKEEFELLTLSAGHMLRAGSYAVAHRDPFDRMLAAQAEVERLTLVTADERLRAFGVETVWGCDAYQP